MLMVCLNTPCLVYLVVCLRTVYLVYKVTWNRNSNLSYCKRSRNVDCWDGSSQLSRSRPRIDCYSACLYNTVHSWAALKKWRPRRTKLVTPIATTYQLDVFHSFTLIDTSSESIACWQLWWTWWWWYISFTEVVCEAVLLLWCSA